MCLEMVFPILYKKTCRMMGTATFKSIRKSFVDDFINNCTDPCPSEAEILKRHILITVT